VQLLLSPPDLFNAMLWLL